MDFEVIKLLLAALEREGVRYAIFGAVALNLHGLARFTEDLDIFVEPEASNIKNLRTALRAVVNDPEIEQLVPFTLIFLPDLERRFRSQTLRRSESHWTASWFLLSHHKRCMT